MSTSSVSRRNFLKTSAWLAVGISIPVAHGCKDDGVNPDPSDTCETTADILGPYYKANSPLRENIIPDGDVTEPLAIIGKVYGNCDDVLKDATVEIWNANTDGEYDVSEDFLFRGKYKTGEDGVYRFKTIIPGRYLNGGTFRPSHIHFRITAPGYQELVSQIYFKDDPFIDTDPWASTTQAQERILTVTQDENGMDTITFDIYLSNV
ncbi:MAG TPA: hypothetical protein VGK59_08215 [Ohtaekwangia sp.]